MPAAIHALCACLIAAFAAAAHAQALQVPVTNPAPPFKEQVRAEEYHKRLVPPGLKDVRIDSKGNAIGVRPAVGWKFGRWVDNVLMQRANGDGAGTGAPELPQ